MAKRVLLLYVGYGDGHKRAAEAIEKALKKRKAEVLSKDMGTIYPIAKSLFEKVYMCMIHSFPWLWRFFHANKKARFIVRPLMFVSQSFSKRKYNNLIKRFNPDVVVCTYAFCAGVVSRLNRNIPLIGVATDYHMHDYWVNKKITKYIVPNLETKKALEKRGIRKEKISVCGIPVNPEFFEKKNIKRSDLKLKNRPTVLMMGGSLGLGPLKKIAQQLNKLEKDMNILVMAGKNKKLQRKISQTDKVKVVPYVDNIHDYMSAADLLITKPSGITTSEAIVKGLPMILMKPIPGQEEKNIPLLLSRGVAVKGNSKTVLDLMSDKDLYKRMQYRQGKMKKVYSMDRAVKIMLK